MLVSRLLRGRDEGSTLVSVLVVMLVLMIGGLAVAAVVTNTSGMLAKTGNRSQAQAAVDAGIAAQTARLESGALACAAMSSRRVHASAA